MIRKFSLTIAFAAALAFIAPNTGAYTVRGDYGTATAVSGAAALNKNSGTITSEALTTAAGSAYTLTLTCGAVKNSDSIVLWSVDHGTNTTAGLEMGKVTPGSGTVTFTVWNRHASAPLNGTLVIRYFVLKS